MEILKQLKTEMYKFLKWETISFCISCTCLTSSFPVLGRWCSNFYCMDSCSVAWEKRKDCIKHNYWYVIFCFLNETVIYYFVQSQEQSDNCFYDVRY